MTIIRPASERWGTRAIAARSAKHDSVSASATTSSDPGDDALSALKLAPSQPVDFSHVQRPDDPPRESPLLFDERIKWERIRAKMQASAELIETLETLRGATASAQISDPAIKGYIEGIENSIAQATAQLHYYEAQEARLGQRYRESALAEAKRLSALSARKKGSATTPKSRV